MTTRKTVRPQYKTIVATGHNVETGEAKDIEIKVPYSNLEGPTDRAEAVWKTITDKDNWKDPTTVFDTDDADFAEEVRDCIVWYHSGAESSFENGTFQVWSMGYYAYMTV